MSEAAAAPSTTGQEITDPSAVGASSASPAPVVEQTPTHQTRMARALAKINGAGKPVAEEPPAAEPAPEEAPAEETPEPAKTDGELPEQKPGESDAKYAARLAKAMADIRKHEAALLAERNEKASLSKEKQDLASELEKLRAELKKRDEDAIYALKAHGGYDAVTRKVLAGELKAPTAEDDIRTQLAETTAPIKSELEQIRAELAAAKAEKEEMARQAEMAKTREQDLQVVKSSFEQLKQRYALATALVTPEHVLEYCYANNVSDPSAALEATEQTVRSQLEVLLQNPSVWPILLKNPKIRETGASYFAQTQSRKSPVSSEGPRAVAADVVSAVTTPKAPALTKDERMKRAISIAFGGGKGGA